MRADSSVDGSSQLHGPSRRATTARPGTGLNYELEKRPLQGAGTLMKELHPTRWAGVTRRNNSHSTKP